MRDRLICVLFLFLLLYAGAHCFSMVKACHFSRDYPILCRISALRNLKSIMKENGKLPHGAFAEAMSKCYIIKDRKRAYLLRNWVKTWLAKRKNGMKIKDMTIAILTEMTSEWEQLYQEDPSRSRIIFNPCENRLHTVNKYAKPILNKYLAHQDRLGYFSNARQKHATYVEILEDPGKYKSFGTKVPSPYEPHQIPKTEKKLYNHSKFLTNVFVTTEKRVQKKKLGLAARMKLVSNHHFNSPNWISAKILKIVWRHKFKCITKLLYIVRF